MRSPALNRPDPSRISACRAASRSNSASASPESAGTARPTRSPRCPVQPPGPGPGVDHPVGARRIAAQAGRIAAATASATAKTAAVATSKIRERTSRPRQYFSGSAARIVAARAMEAASR